MEDLSASILKRKPPVQSDLGGIDEISIKKIKPNNASMKQWYENLPKDEDIDDSVFKDAFDKILQSVSNEMVELDIKYIINRYKPVLSEFYELSSMFRAGAKKYNVLFEKFINTLCNIYQIEREPMIVYPNKYSPKDWGNIYWEFLHLSSILLSFAFENGLIKTLLDFPTLVYNIDVILPCAKCAYHYSTIKNSDDVKQIIKSMSFGSIMISLQIFHNVITANVDKTPDYINVPNRDRFLISDFALKYKCIDVQSENTRKSTDYIRSCIDWQPTTHVLLSIILSTYCSQPSYDRVSNLLKYKLYAKNKHFSNIDLNVRNADVRPIDTSDIIYVSMTEKQIQYCLMRALILQFQDTNLKQEAIEQNKRLNFAIISMYKKYNDEIKNIVSNNLSNPDQAELRDSLLMKLEKVKNLPIEPLH